MRHIKSVVKGLVWETCSFAAVLAVVYLLVDDKRDALVLTLVWPLLKIAVWYPYERLFRCGWRRFEAWLSEKETENADTEAR